MGRSVSAETVRNVIRHAGYSSRVAKKKPFISLQNQKKRLEFTKTHQLKTDNFWKKVIFSDESKFNIFGSDGRRTVWRKPNTVLDPKNLRPTVKHGGGSVMQRGVHPGPVAVQGVVFDWRQTGRTAGQGRNWVKKNSWTLELSYWTMTDGMRGRTTSSNSSEMYRHICTRRVQSSAPPPSSDDRSYSKAGISF
ncbi:transposable element Tcb1 transposase [Trichonephila clavipes]|nr:transposable element Tcb1 transposase [Trichonephila clavipes]